MKTIKAISPFVAVAAAATVFATLSTTATALVVKDAANVASQLSAEVANRRLLAVADEESEISIPSCSPSAYFEHIETFDGRNIVGTSASSSNNCREERLNRQSADVGKAEHGTRAEASQPPPIEIIHQGEAYVQFRVHPNATWFVSAVSEAGLLDVETISNPISVATMFPMDQFGSQGCSVVSSEPNNNKGFDYVGDVLQADCNGDHSVAMVDLYARFASNSSDSISINLEFPRCCNDDTNRAFSKVVGYTFKLSCSPTTATICDNDSRKRNFGDAVENDSSSSVAPSSPASIAIIYRRLSFLLLAVTVFAIQ